MNKLSVSVVCLLILFFVLFFAYTQIGVNKEKDNNEWSIVIKENGPDNAYKIFGDKVESYSINHQHTEAHNFGGALYDTVGIKAFKICDAQYSYGCIHEFIGRVGINEGIESIAKLNEKCIENFEDDSAFCLHGIGHGLVAYFGYSEQDLMDASEVCGIFPGNDPIGGCNGGIFMEYNIRSTLAIENGKTPVRPILKNDFLNPCLTLDGDTQLACAYWAPQWWHSSDLNYKRDIETFQEIGKRCRLFSNLKLVSSCFSGIGNILSVDFNLTAADEVSKFCQASSSDHKDRTNLCTKTALGS